MENSKGDYGQKKHNLPQKKQDHDSRKNMDSNQAKSAKDLNSNSQRSSENGREANVPNSESGSNKVNQADIEIGKRLENQDAENTNTVPDSNNRISDPEDVNDKNMENAVNKANSRVPKDSSKKAKGS